MILPKNQRLLELTENRLELLIQTIIRNAKELSKAEIAHFRKETFSELSESLGLDLSRKSKFIKWPMFFNTEDDAVVHVCSVCFGALTLVDRNSKEESYSRAAQDCFNSTINTIILFHLKEKLNNQIFWPANYNWGLNQLDAGTINQTTLCISTLLKLDFLKLESKYTGVKITEECRHNRIKFMISAIRWILDMRNKMVRSCSWSYARVCKDVSQKYDIHSAILPSHYCIITLEKCHLYFINNKVVNSIVTSIDNYLLSEIREACDFGIRYFEINQCDNGAFFINSKDTEPSLIHTFFGELVLCYSKDDASKLKKAVKYISRKLSMSKDYFVEKNLFEEFKYQVRRIIVGSNTYPYKERLVFISETFEIYPETLLILASERALNFNAKNSFKIMNAIQRRVITDGIYRSYERIFGHMDKAGEDLYVKGNRKKEEHKYPIYNIYYAKLALSYLTKYLKESKTLLTVPLSYIGLCAGFIIAILGLLLILYLLDKISFFEFLISSFISSLLVMFSRLIFKRDKYQKY